MIGVGTTIFLVRPQTFASGVSYLLDTYSTDTAYSLRALSSSTTNVVRVRRSSDNSESDFTADEITDGTLTTWTGANDGFVTKWYNQGTAGSTYDGVQTTAANQPKLVSSGVVLTAPNGQPAMQGDGTNDEFSLANTYTLTATDMTVATVYSRASTGINSTPIGQTSTNAFYVAAWLTNDNIQHSESTARVVATSDTATGDFIFFAWDDGTNINYYRNGSSLYSAAYTNVGTTWTGLLCLSSLHHNGYIQEVIRWGSDVSANRTDIESDINTHYSIY